LRFVELPWGQDPDDVIRTGGRDAFEALVAQAEPLDARLWRHELDAEPLSTPEAWAGLKERLIAHAATIGHPDLGRIYREDWLNRFYQLRRPEASAQRAQSGFARGASRATFKNGRFVPPERPPGDIMRGIGKAGVDAPTARALMLGFANFPEELPVLCEQLAALPIADGSTAKLRDELVNAAFSGAALDREGLATILGGDGATGPKAPWAFPSPAATATRTAPEAIWPQQWRSSLRRRKWTGPWKMQRNG
jgi:DNA primase